MNFASLSIKSERKPKPFHTPFPAPVFAFEQNKQKCSKSLFRQHFSAQHLARKVAYSQKMITFVVAYN